jgi:predicted acylesterase/phospholipase RssA
MAGGGPEGAIYEIGALRALDEAIEGLDLNRLQVYVGVSAGAFLAANLANDLTTKQMVRAIVKKEPGEHPFIAEKFLRPAIGEIAMRAGMVPKLLWEALAEYVLNPEDIGLFDSLLRLGRAVPVGFFDNEPVRKYLEKIYNMKGRTDDFRELTRKLYVVAVDLDSGEVVRFGEPGFDDVPISRAVQASGALPGLYPPVEINGRHYVDGVLRKTMHASVALDAGAGLVLCLNPIVPVDTRDAVERGIMRRGRLIHRGWPTVLSQTFRTLIHSRLEVGLACYGNRYKGADVVLLEPRRDDYRMFFTNIFRFSSRKYVVEHAYEATRQELLNRREELEPILARHGLRLRVDFLERQSSIWDSCGLGDRSPGPMTHLLSDLEKSLDRLDNWVSNGH